MKREQQEADKRRAVQRYLAEFHEATTRLESEIASTLEVLKRLEYPEVEELRVSSQKDLDRWRFSLMRETPNVPVKAAWQIGTFTYRADARENHDTAGFYYLVSDGRIAVAHSHRWATHSELSTARDYAAELVSNARETAKVDANLFAKVDEARQAQSLKIALSTVSNLLDGLSDLKRRVEQQSGNP